RNVRHAQRLDAVAEVPAAGVHAEGMPVREAHPGPEAPAPAPARRRGMIDLDVLARPEDERRPPARAGRGAEAHRLPHRRAAIVTERRMRRLALAQLGLAGGGDLLEIVEGAEILPTQAGRFELSLEERHRHRPDAIELTIQALLLERAHALDRHRLDLGIVVL